MKARRFLPPLVVSLALHFVGLPAQAEPVLKAGAAKIDISRVEGPPSGNTLYAKALVLSQGETTAVLITVDAVAIGEIGSIPNDYLSNVRTRLKEDLSVAPENVLVNASHCHGLVCRDIEERTVKVVKAAWEKLEPVRVAAGSGHEDRIMENRRLFLKDGSEADVRHAYSLPPRNEVAAIGPVDPEIGILRLDRLDGEPLALVYNFACHPIQGTPATGGNTADIVGFASKVIEENLGEDTVALFVQGAGGDINPVRYKDVNHPRDAEPLGHKLGLSALRASQKLASAPASGLGILNHTVRLPRSDHAERIRAMIEKEQRLLKSLKGTSLNLESFLPLYMKYSISPEFPSYDSHRYLLEEKQGRNDLKKMDEQNRAQMEKYAANIRTMEELTRLRINLALLDKHQKRNQAAGMRPIPVEVAGLRVGDFRLVTFPGELTVRIGLDLKKRSPHPLTFVAGYTNGYIYYAPTTDQLKNRGGAQEDSDCLLAPGWENIFESACLELIEKL